MKQIALVGVALLVAASSAIAQDERHNFDANTNFHKFKTYKWVEIKDAQKVDEPKDKEIKDALDAIFVKKGLTKTDSETADLYIGYQAGVLAEKQFAFYSIGWEYGPGWYREGWYIGFESKTKSQISTIYAGQLAVDMYDSKSRFLVWRGVVSKALDSTATPDKPKQSLSKSMAKLLKEYPPIYLPN